MWAWWTIEQGPRLWVEPTRSGPWLPVCYLASLQGTPANEPSTIINFNDEWVPDHADEELPESPRQQGASGRDEGRRAVFVLACACVSAGRLRRVEHVLPCMTLVEKSLECVLLISGLILGTGCSAVNAMTEEEVVTPEQRSLEIIVVGTARGRTLVR
jgi:hypothetical protein